MLDKIFAMVTAMFGITSLPRDKEGKSVLTSDMEKTLSDKFGDKFLQAFKKDLAEAEANGNDPSRNADVEKLQAELKELKGKFEAAETKGVSLEETNQQLQGKIETLSKTEEPDNAETMEAKKGNAGQKPGFKPDMTLMHNRVIDNYFNGDGSMHYSTNKTIDTAELQKEFGRYVTGQRVEIMQSLTMGLSCTQYMTTVVTDLLEWRASQAIIDSVLQQFTPYWTPSKKAKFTPIIIKNYILKVNQPIKPADIIDQYIGYLYDEKLTPDQMPIVKYIIDALVLPKLQEDLELAMATGKFVEFTPAGDGEAAPDNAAMQSMQGYLTTLREMKAAGKEIGKWLLDGETLTMDNIIDKMNDAVDSVSLLYKRKKMNVHADPDLITMYQRAYLEKYKNRIGADEVKLKLDFSNFTFVPLDGMIGTRAFFITPKENFKHLMSLNVNNAEIFMQLQNYDVKVFMEFRKGTGFAMAEAIFAYLPPEAGSAGGGL